jgi:Mannosyl-glycoprotein endo-beta-N-acetylglucosaminidase
LVGVIFWFYFCVVKTIYLNPSTSCVMNTNPTYGNKPARPAGRQLRDGYPGGQPIINWGALWYRIRMGIHRIFLYLHYSMQSKKEQKQPADPALLELRSGFGRTLRYLQIAGILAALYYVTYREINLSIHLRSPIAAIRSGSDALLGAGEVEPMSIGRGVSLVGNASQSVAASGSVRLTEEMIRSYVNRFSRVAWVEYEKYGIPPAINLAQAILESHAGSHPHARQRNNHFGPVMGTRTFESAWANWRAHSLLLKNHYAALFAHGDDLKAWAKGLQSMGYSQDPQYAAKLLTLIQKYHLNQSPM